MDFLYKCLSFPGSCHWGFQAGVKWTTFLQTRERNRYFYCHIITKQEKKKTIDTLSYIYGGPRHIGKAFDNAHLARYIYNEKDRWMGKFINTFVQASAWKPTQQMKLSALLALHGTAILHKPQWLETVF